jgi:hypothetical protein
MRLTEQQHKFFDTFGFLKFPGLFADEVDDIIDAFEKVFADQGGGYGGRPHDSQRRSAIVPFIDDSEYLSGLLDDPRIEGIGVSLLGDDFNYMTSDGNLYVTDTGWHSDSCRNVNFRSVMEDPDKHRYRGVKTAFYLDPLTRDSGCLRVVPGSHKAGDRFANSLEEHLRESEDTLGVHGRDVPAMALETLPGDLLMFDLCTKHASFGGSDRRRMFTINLQERFGEEDLPQLRESISTMAGTKAGYMRFGAERAYGKAMLDKAGPQRMRHLEQRLANDGALREKVGELREWDATQGPAQ